MKNKKRQDFNIDLYTKPGKNIVVELDDEVEYIINDIAVSFIKGSSGYATLVRVIDRELVLMSLSRIMAGIKRGGIVDYLSKQTEETD